MKKITLLTFAVFAATALAATHGHTVTFYQDSMIEGKTLKAGEYKISVMNGNAILSQGKETFEVPAHEVAAVSKISSTELTYKDKTDLEAIQIGGSQTKIVFEGGAATPSGM